MRHDPVSGHGHLAGDFGDKVAAAATAVGLPPLARAFLFLALAGTAALFVARRRRMLVASTGMGDETGAGDGR